jgi:hypothetical protein
MKNLVKETMANRFDRSDGESNGDLGPRRGHPMRRQARGLWNHIHSHQAGVGRCQS